MKAVRDDEIAAEAMGVNIVKVKSTSFVISSFMAGVGGALLGHMITTIDPKMFTLILTFNILLIVVLGGNGSITGSVLGAIIVTVLMEALRFLDMPMNFLFIKTDGLPGLADGHILDTTDDRGPVQAARPHGQQGILLGRRLRPPQAQAYTPEKGGRP